MRVVVVLHVSVSLLALAHGLPAAADAQQQLKTWDPTNHNGKAHDHNECEEKAKISSAWCCTCKKCALVCPHTYRTRPARACPMPAVAITGLPRTDGTSEH